MSSTTPTPLPIRSLAPLESGGIEAREGFNVQDHVAAGFCIRMLSDPLLLEVWCESQDDITLIWKSGEVEEVEFVQVKKNEHDQLWSIALLCSRIEGKAGSSILERSLANDRCSEACRFRIITCRPVKKELKVLTHPVGDEARIAAKDELLELVKDVGGRVGTFKSKNGRGHDFWAARAFWEFRHSVQSIEDANLLELQRFIESMGEPFYVDRLAEMYSRILAMVRDAALARNAAKSRLLKADFIAWLKRSVQELVKAGATGSHKLLAEKLGAAALAEDVIASAVELRRKYRFEWLESEYTDERDSGLVDGEVSAVLLNLRSQLDAGLFPDSGPEFHAECSKQVQALHSTLPTKSTVTRATLAGCMYSITGRCGHRFRKAS